MEDDESFSEQDDSDKDPGQASSETGSPSASEGSYSGGVLGVQMAMGLLLGFDFSILFLTVIIPSTL